MRIDGIAQCFYDLGRLQSFLGGGDLFAGVAELVEDTDMLATLERMVAPVPEFETKHFDSVFDFRFYRMAIYALVRALRPRLIVETGVLHGLTSAFILRALDLNGCGRLVSIDLPSYPEAGPANRDGYNACLPVGREPGWVVPENYRQRWDLRLGSSTALLPGVLEAGTSLEFFIHDSEHTYATMWTELSLAWPALAHEGVLLCDNVTDSGAFFDFCRRVGRHPIVLPAPDRGLLSTLRFGLIRR